MSWSADPQALDQLRQIFKATLSSNNQERNLANDALRQAKQQPEIENYLLSLLVLDDNSTRSDVRAAAGVNLKNSILRQSQGNALPDRQFIKENVIKGLISPDQMVRNITGNVITSLFSIYGLQGWPQALPQLIELAKGESSPRFIPEIASMSALSKICEDSYLSLDIEFNGERPLNYMIQNFLTLMIHPHSGQIRALAIQCITQFISLKSQSFLIHLDVFLSNLFQLASDSNEKVRKNICAAFSHVLETRPDKLMPHLDGIIDYCLHLMKDKDEDVALEACEFLLVLSASSEIENNRSGFAPKLKLIVPVVLEKMVYSEEEIFYIKLQDEKDNAEIADKDEDIKPQNAKSKEIQSSNGTKKKQQAHDSDDSDDDDDDDEDDDDELMQWSLRKCSASTLEVLSSNLPAEVLDISLPILQENIVSNEWQIREAAILAFGAMSSSCMELSRDKLPSLVPFLVDRLQDDEARVRQITCWTLSTYSTWIADEAHAGGDYANYYQPTFQSIVTCSLDRKKVVQEAACSALSSFIEQSDISLIQFYIGPLLEHFGKCFQTYQRKNLTILYDCVQTLVEKAGYENLSSDPELINKLLPPLLEKWHSLTDEDNDLWPLLECMAAVAATLRELFAPYAVPVYERAINILSNCIQIEMQTQTDPSIDVPEKNFVVTSLDLIDGLIQGFGSHSVDLIQQNRANLMELLLLCFEDKYTDVRQSAYALLGDIGIYAVDIAKPHLSSIFISIGNEVNNRSYSTIAVYHNAIWALGEFVLRLNYNEMKDYLPNLVDLIIPVLLGSDMQQAVLETAAVCLGRMGINGGAQVLAPRLSEFIAEWCSHMIYFSENEEKSTSFQGMLNIINANPDQGFGGLSTKQGKKNLSLFITCIGNYMEPPEELQNTFHQFLASYKSLIGAEIWQSQVLSSIDQETLQQLSHYGI
ncbi:putative importin, protein [Scheffersomyces coipomensis]|uniref:putative importin, protein n=1 Tax=Scheffersomyces coipomensis TaxID=1788519 RepID=UPI00315D5D4A